MQLIRHWMWLWNRTAGGGWKNFEKHHLKSLDRLEETIGRNMVLTDDSGDSPEGSGEHRESFLEETCHTDSAGGNRSVKGLPVHARESGVWHWGREGERPWYGGRRVAGVSSSHGKAELGAEGLGCLAEGVPSKVLRV